MDWPRDLIERAHRLSAPRQDGRSRPMIAKFLRWGDAMRVLGNRGARENMKREGIHLSQDYTKRQQNQLKELRAKGKQGYFLRGKLYIKGEGDRQDQNNRNRSETAEHRGGRGGGREGGRGVGIGERGERWTANTTGGVEGSACRGGWGGILGVGGWEGGRGNGIGTGEADCDRGSADINRSRRKEETVRQGWKDWRKNSVQNSELTNTQWTCMMSQHESAFSLQDKTSVRWGWEGGRGGERGWERRNDGKGGQRWSGESEEGEGERRAEWEGQGMEGNKNGTIGQTGRGRGGRESITHVGVNASMNKRNEGESERGRENAKKNENEVNKGEIEISDVSSVCSAYSETEIQRLREDGLIVGERKKRVRDRAEENERSGRQNEKERESEEEREREEESESEKGGEEEEKKREATIQVDTDDWRARAYTASDRPGDCASGGAYQAAGTAQRNERTFRQTCSITPREYREREKAKNSTNAGGTRGRATFAKKDGGEKGRRRLSGQGGNTNKVTSTQASKQMKPSGLVQQTLRNTTNRLSFGRGEEEGNRGGKGGREIDIDKETTVRCGLRSRSQSNPVK